MGAVFLKAPEHSFWDSMRPLCGHSLSEYSIAYDDVMVKEKAPAKIKI